MTKKDLKAVIVNAILSNDKAAVRALMLWSKPSTTASISGAQSKPGVCKRRAPSDCP